MPRIIAYTYCADVHCPDCADAAYAAGRLVRSGRQVPAPEWVGDSARHPIDRWRGELDPNFPAPRVPELGFFTRARVGLVDLWLDMIFFDERAKAVPLCGH